MIEDDWHALLDRAPGDMDLRQGFAAWLQDEADELARAEFQRWLAEEEKWPTNKPIDAAEQGWAWYWSQEPITEPARNATLAPWSLDHMPKVRWLYPTRRAAEEVVFQAWLSWRRQTEQAGKKTARTPAKKKRPRKKSTRPRRRPGRG